MNETTQVVKQKLARDLRTTIDDVEELLRLTAGQVGERMSDVRNRLQSSLADSRAHLTHLQTEAIERGKQVTANAEEYVHDHPWKVLGVVALVGVLLGAIISRR